MNVWKWRCRVDELNSKNEDWVNCILWNIWEWCISNEINNDSSVLKWWCFWQESISIDNNTRYITNKEVRDNQTWIRIIFDPKEPNFSIWINKNVCNTLERIWNILIKKEIKIKRPIDPFRQEWIPSEEKLENYKLLVKIWENSLELTKANLSDNFNFTTKHNLFVCVCGWWAEDIVWWYKLKDLISYLYWDLKALEWKYLKFTSLEWPWWKISEKSPEIKKYSTCVSIEYALQEDSMLATHLNWEILSRELWYPCRVYIPWLYWYKQVKCIHKIELVDKLELGLWEEYKWYKPSWIINDKFEIVLIR